MRIGLDVHGVLGMEDLEYRGFPLDSSLAQYWNRLAGNKCIVGAACSFATQLQFVFGYIIVSATNFHPIIEIHSVWVRETADFHFLNCRWPG